MAYYKNASFLTQEYGSEFDVAHAPGGKVPYSGIYRCTGCGNSSTNVKGHTFPPQDAHEHQPWQTPIRWQLTVKSHWA